MASEVFCSTCKHFLCWNYGDGLCISVGEECNHPNNVRYDRKSNAERAWKKKVYLKSHKEINSNNNCTWYQYTMMPRDAFTRDMVICFAVIFVLVALIFSPIWLGALFK